NISLIRNKEKIFDNLNAMDDSVSYSEIKENLLDKDIKTDTESEEDTNISEEIKENSNIEEK
ncbi:hypothetical protein LI062_10840, partial [Clostridium perfringens]|nr:hypothetical protein [Clostridium perfringens]